MHSLAKEMGQHTALTLLSAVLFVIFFELNHWIFSNFEYSSGISWVFLPAGFRIILVLVLGLPGALGLMLGSWFIDRDLLWGSTATLAFLNGVVAGFVPWLLMLYLRQRQWLSQNLHEITIPQLLNLTLLFAAASALGHQVVWWLMDRPNLNIWVDIWPMFVGNALGSLLLLYSLKFVFSRLLRKSSNKP